MGVLLPVRLRQIFFLVYDVPDQRVQGFGIIGTPRFDP